MLIVDIIQEFSDIQIEQVETTPPLPRKQPTNLRRLVAWFRVSRVTCLGCDVTTKNEKRSVSRLFCGVFVGIVPVYSITEKPKVSLNPFIKRITSIQKVSVVAYLFPLLVFTESWWIRNCRLAGPLTRASGLAGPGSLRTFC